jgi:glutathione S-transferase
MKLYQFPFSPNCQKVVALANEVNLPLELTTVELFKGEARTPPMLAKNPNGKVPVLEDGDFVLWESNAMLAYIAVKAGRADLAPTTLRERAEVDRWTSWAGAHFGPAIRKVAVERIVKKLAGLGAPDEAVVKAGIEEFAVTVSVLEKSLGSKEYVCGRLTIADFALAPYAALTESCGLGLEPYPKARAWLERMVARDSMKQALSAARGAA